MRRRLEQDFTSTLIVRGREVLRSLAATRHSIGARLLIGVLLFSSSVTLILTVIQLYTDYRRDVSAIESRLNQISGSYLDSLAEGLWALDEKQLRLQLDGILRLPDIRAVEVREAGTTVNQPLVRLSRNPETSIFAREYPLLHKVQGQDKVIGTLRVEATRANIYRRLVNTLLTNLASHAATIFLVSLFILYIFHYLVTRHLSAIAADVGRHRVKDAALELHLRRRPPRHEDELQRVVTAFNALSHNLYAAYRDLAEREAKIRRLVDSNIIGIFIWNIDGQIVEANDAFLHMVGYDRDDLASGRVNRTDLTPPEWQERDARTVAEAKATGTVRPFEKEYFRKDGDRIPVLIGVTAFDEKRDQGVGFVLDLTDRKRAEAEARDSERRYREVQAELAHASRVTALGQLTASITHEVRQPLAAVKMSGNTALRWLTKNPPEIDEAKQSIENIVKDANRAADVISRIHSLVRKAAPSKDILDINEAVLEVIGLVRAEATKAGVTIQLQLADNLPRIQGDRVQLQQVMINLIINAIQAMTDVEGLRELHISTEQNELDGVRVTVRDSGSGVSPDELPHLFEPFYTTKPGGMGMGLSISRTIVEDHGGRLWASANEPRGAIFQFTVPTHADSIS